MMDPYLYPGTDVLKNIFGETDSDVLGQIEANYTALRLKELAYNPMKGDFDITHFYAMHGYIFQDIFECAGQQRTINIEKAEDALGGISIEYADVFDIAKECGAILRSLNNAPMSEQLSWRHLPCLRTWAIYEKMNTFKTLSSMHWSGGYHL